MSIGGGRAGTGYIELRPELTKSFQKDMERLFQNAMKSLRVTVDASKINVSGKIDTTRLAKQIKDQVEGVKVRSPKFDNREIDAEAARVGKRMSDGVDRHRSQIGSKLVTGGAMLGGGLIAGGLLAKDAFQAYGEQADQVSKAQRVFGDNFKYIEAQAANAAKSMGMSKTEAIGSAGTFGALFSGMQIGAKESAYMSLALNQLAGDLGSFYGVATDDALVALRSGLVGESEPLRRFGVNLNEATIKAEAFRLGLTKADVDQVKLTKSQIDLSQARYDGTQILKKYGANSGEYIRAQNKIAKAEQDVEKAMAGSKVELTAAQKAQASYSLILQQSSVAHGDFALTADGPVNRAKTLAASIEDLKAQFGEAVSPVFEAGLKTALAATDSIRVWWTENGAGVKQWITDTFGVDPAASFREGLHKITQWFTDHGLTMQNFKTGLGEVKTGWDQLTGATENNGSVLGTWHENFINNVNDFREGLTGGKEPMDALADGWNRITTAVSEFFSNVGEVLTGFKNDVLDPLWGTYQNIMGAAGGLLGIGDNREDMGWREKLFGFDSGGVVPGKRGAGRLVYAHGGETILPTHKESTQAAIARLQGQVDYDRRYGAGMSLGSGSFDALGYGLEGGVRRGSEAERRYQAEMADREMELSKLRAREADEWRAAFAFAAPRANLQSGRAMASVGAGPSMVETSLYLDSTLIGKAVTPVVSAGMRDTARARRS